MFQDGCPLSRHLLISWLHCIMSSAGVQSNFHATVSLFVRQQWSITWFLFSLQSPVAQISRSGCGIGCLWNKSTGLQDSAHHILPCRVQHPGRVAQPSYSPFPQFGFCCVWAGFYYCLLALLTSQLDLLVRACLSMTITASRPSILHFCPLLHTHESLVIRS